MIQLQTEIDCWGGTIMGDLPADIWRHICRSGDLSSLPALSQVCRAASLAAREESLCWRRAALQGLRRDALIASIANTAKQSNNNSAEGDANADFSLDPDLGHFSTLAAALAVAESRFGLHAGGCFALREGQLNVDAEGLWAVAALQAGANAHGWRGVEKLSELLWSGECGRVTGEEALRLPWALVEFLAGSGVLPDAAVDLYRTGNLEEKYVSTELRPTIHIGIVPDAHATTAPLERALCGAFKRRGGLAFHQVKRTAGRGNQGAK
jgi:hypothetical protein